MKTKTLLFIFGLALFLEGIFVQTDWSRFGIQSIFIGDIWLHHWVIGILLMGWSRE